MVSEIENFRVVNSIGRPRNLLDARFNVKPCVPPVVSSCIEGASQSRLFFLLTGGKGNLFDHSQFDAGCLGYFFRRESILQHR